MSYIGIDLGGTKILGILADDEGRIISRIYRKTEAFHGYDYVFAEMVDTINKLTPPEGVKGIGVGVPAPVDPFKGEVYDPPNLPGWGTVPLVQRLVAALQTPQNPAPVVVILNDANAAALAEFKFGAALQAGRPIHHLVYLSIGTGIGGGVIIDDKLLLGANGFAAELGHIVIDVNGPRCNCGNIGCIEIVASGTALAHEAAMVVRSRKPTGLYDAVEGDPSKITVETVVKVAQEGDPTAQALIQHEGMLIGVGAVNCIHTFNPELVVIGGGVSNSGELLFESIRSTVADRVMPAYEGTYTIAKAALGGDAGALGAVAGVIDHLQSTQRLA